VVMHHFFLLSWLRQLRLHRLAMLPIFFQILFQNFSYSEVNSMLKSL
jgi:hypothetical protein